MVILYHGTSKDNLQNIKIEGFNNEAWFTEDFNTAVIHATHDRIKFINKYGQKGIIRSIRLNSIIVCINISKETLKKLNIEVDTENDTNDYLFNGENLKFLNDIIFSNNFKIITSKTVTG